MKKVWDAIKKPVYVTLTVIGISSFGVGMVVNGWHCNNKVIQPAIAFDQLSEISDRIVEKYGETDGKLGISPTENYNLWSKIFNEHDIIYSHGKGTHYPDGRRVSFVKRRDILLDYEKNHPINK